MIIISVRFNKSICSKKYEYLLVNPENYNIDKDVALIYAVGAMKGRLINSYLYVDSLRRVHDLPPVVSKRIVVLDENNNIRIEDLGHAELRKEFLDEKVEEAPISVTPTEIKEKKTKKKKHYCSPINLTQDQIEKRLLGHKIRR